MPQGGVGQNESFMDAMKRELYEGMRKSIN